MTQQTRIIILIAYIALFSVSCKSKKKTPDIPASLDNIGEQFKLANIVDTSGNIVELDFTKSDINIVDIWNNFCPPCIEEMKQFPDLIKGKETKISIFSLSLTQFWLWQKTVKEHKSPFEFLDNQIPNWKQYNLMTKDNPRFKNELSSDRLKELRHLYKVTANPAYFVVDRNGKILSRPWSAVQFLKELE